MLNLEQCTTLDSSVFPFFSILIFLFYILVASHSHRRCNHTNSESKKLRSAKQTTHLFAEAKKNKRIKKTKQQTFPQYQNKFLTVAPKTIILLFSSTLHSLFLLIHFSFDSLFFHLFLTYFRVFLFLLFSSRNIFLKFHSRLKCWYALISGTLTYIVAPLKAMVYTLISLTEVQMLCFYPSTFVK